MNASKNSTMNTTKGLSAGRELFERVHKMINYDYSWPEYEKAEIQVSLIEWYKACHFLLLLLLQFCNSQVSVI